eukprot:6389644-Prymnesium_polylepis.1
MFLGRAGGFRGGHVDMGWEMGRWQNDEHSAGSSRALHPLPQTRRGMADASLTSIAGEQQRVGERALQHVG